MVFSAHFMDSDYHSSGSEYSPPPQRHARGGGRGYDRGDNSDRYDRGGYRDGRDGGGGGHRSHDRWPDGSREGYGGRESYGGREGYGGPGRNGAEVASWARSVGGGGGGGGQNELASLAGDHPADHMRTKRRSRDARDSSGSLPLPMGGDSEARVRAVQAQLELMQAEAELANARLVRHRPARPLRMPAGPACPARPVCCTAPWSYALEGGQCGCCLLLICSHYHVAATLGKGGRQLTGLSACGGMCFTISQSAAEEAIKMAKIEKKKRVCRRLHERS